MPDLRRLAMIAHLMDVIQVREDCLFDINVFATDGFEEHKCGTSACAMGWATTIPEFRNLGLGFGYNNISVSLHFYEGENFGAIENFLDISEQEAQYLFDPATYGHDPELGFDDWGSECWEDCCECDVPKVRCSPSDVSNRIHETYPLPPLSDEDKEMAVAGLLPREASSASGGFQCPVS